MILHGPGVPGPAVERGLAFNNTNNTSGIHATTQNTGKVKHIGNDTGSDAIAAVSNKEKGSTQTKATLRSVIMSKYINYDGYNLHDDLAFKWHPGTSEVYHGDHGDYHDPAHEDEDSYVTEHGADIHGDRGWHAGHGENGYGYGINHHDGYDMNYGHGNYHGHGDYHGEGDHYGGEHHTHGHHQ